MTIRWTRPPSALIGPLQQRVAQIKEEIATIATVHALQLEADAKANRPWADDTGAARAGLIGRAFRSSRGMRIVLAHQVRYGWALELARGGRYAILWPTLVRSLPRLRVALGQIGRRRR